ncbi:amphi-Trp domain-containing protein [Neorhizobium sp. DT-125]|uniref:amphi-Trp domain-containing protein n=1 Tax=Neorhizobium sp. DT-125 TaxID=3396163 RepID=UPI003F1A5BA5
MESGREIEKDYSLAEFVAELRRLADTLESNGRFTIKIDEEEVLVSEEATASIAFEIEEGRAELEFQLSWEADEAEDDAEGVSEDENEAAV